MNIFINIIISFFRVYNIYMYMYVYIYVVYQEKKNHNS